MLPRTIFLYTARLFRTFALIHVYINSGKNAPDTTLTHTHISTLKRNMQNADGSISVCYEPKIQWVEIEYVMVCHSNLVCDINACKHTGAHAFA